ncbi:MAG: ABC transporter ATP-binding protein [SAR202 cluster bacterium]|nr:ABC transporter ATP-binding protein [SAR202 cluster bacterium]
MPLIDAMDVHKTYRLGRSNVVRALQGVNMSLESGEMVAIMGPSGCGKSTLMHIVGLLQPPSTNGTKPVLKYRERDMTTLSDRERTRIRATEMGFVFQAFNLVSTLNAVENVALAAEYAGQPKPKAKASALDALGLVGLAERAGHRPMELSGGEQQRVAIARALVNRPGLILADEPTGNLDSANSKEVMELLRRFNREQKQTILLVTHDPEVGKACSRIITMRDGKVTAV